MKKKLHITHQLGGGKYVIQVLSPIFSLFFPVFLPNQENKYLWARVDFFSPIFSILCVFSPELKNEKYHFLPYFPLFLFHPSYFHSNQTKPNRLAIMCVRN